MKHVITIIEYARRKWLRSQGLCIICTRSSPRFMRCYDCITVIGALLPGCASIDSFNKAHPEVLSAADQLCHVVHQAHEAEADASVQTLPPPEPGAN